MEYQNINSEEERIFPYYKGKYLGIENIGYANIKAARKFMKKIPEKDVYDECFGSKDEYIRTHTYLYKLSTRRLRFYINGTNTYDTELYDYDVNFRIYLHELDESTRTQILTDLAEMKYQHGSKEDLRRALEFQRKHNLFHHIFTEDKEYLKAYSEYVSKHVEFKRGILKKQVILLD